MKNKKILLGIFTIFLIIIVILACGLICFKIEILKPTNDQNSINDIKNNVSNNNESKIIENTKYIEITVGDEKAEELKYKSLIKIEDRDIISELEKMINLGKEHNFDNAFGLDIPPYAIFHLENGNKIKVVAVDNLEMDSDKGGNYILVTINEDEENKKIYKVQDEIETYFTKLYNENENKDNNSNENYIVLYNGWEIENKIGAQYENYMRITDNNKNKYDITYYNYEKDKSNGAKKGKFGKTNIYDGYSYVENVNKIAISKQYNAIPRTSKKLKELPKQLEDMLDYSEVNIEQVDLEGDGKLEYIASAQKFTKAGDYEGVTSNEAYSEIILFDSKFNKIATLASWENNNIEEDSKEQYLQLEDVIYVDIDNDNNMEILLNLPSYDSSVLSIYKYNNNKIDGEIDYKVNIEP